MNQNNTTLEKIGDPNSTTNKTRTAKQTTLLNYFKKPEDATKSSNEETEDKTIHNVSIDSKLKELFEKQSNTNEKEANLDLMEIEQEGDIHNHLHFACQGQGWHPLSLDTSYMEVIKLFVQRSNVAESLEFQQKLFSLSPGVLKTPLPFSYDPVRNCLVYEGLLLPSSLVRGNASSTLYTKILDVWSLGGQQNTSVFALVQTKGYGKTKSVLDMAKKTANEEVWVIPIRFLGASWLRASTYINGLTQRFKEALISPSGGFKHSRTSFPQILAFNTTIECFLNLWCTAHLVLFTEIWPDITKEPRELVRIFLMESVGPSAVYNLLEHVMVYLPIEQLQVNFDSLFQNFSRRLEDFRKQYGHKNIILFFDEVHQLKVTCKDLIGRILPEKDRKNDHGNPGEVVKRFSNATFQTTSLFYSLGIICRQFIAAAEKYGQVMASTEFTIYSEMSVEDSPWRGKLTKISEMSTLTEADIKSISSHLISEAPDKVAAFWQGRPYFFCDLLMPALVHLLCTKAMDVDSIWQTAHSQIEQKTLEEITDLIRNRADRNNLASGIAESTYSEWLYYAIIMDNGTLQLNPKDITEIISRGLATLTSSNGNYLVYAGEPIYKQALQRHFEKVKGNRHNDPIFKVIRSFYSESVLALGADTSIKGSVMERMIARALMLDSQARSDLDSWPFLTRHNPNFRLFNCLSAILDTAGTTEALNFATCCQAMAQCPESKILFPSTNAGPDLWFKAHIKQNSYFVAIQSKNYKEQFSFNEFCNSCLRCLDPMWIFRKRSKEILFPDNGMLSETDSSHERQKWIEALRLGLIMPPFVRIIYSSMGFSIDTWYYVAEFNSQHPNTPIYLVQADEVFFGSLQHIQRTSPTECPSHKIVLQSQVPKKIPVTDRKLWTVDYIANLLKQRGLSVGGKKEEMIIRLHNATPKFPENLFVHLPAADGSWQRM